MLPGKCERDASLQELFEDALAADLLWQPVARSAVLPAAEGADPDVLEQVSWVHDASALHLCGTKTSMLLFHLCAHGRTWACLHLAPDRRKSVEVQPNPTVHPNGRSCLYGWRVGRKGCQA